MLVWHLQEFPTGPTGTSSQSEQQQRSGPQEGAVLDGNEIKKACLSSEEKSSVEKRGGRWGAQGRIGKGSAGQKKGLFKTV